MNTSQNREAEKDRQERRKQTEQELIYEINQIPTIREEAIDLEGQYPEIYPQIEKIRQKKKKKSIVTEEKVNIKLIKVWSIILISSELSNRDFRNEMVHKIPNLNHRRF